MSRSVLAMPALQDLEDPPLINAKISTREASQEDTAVVENASGA